MENKTFDTWLETIIKEVEKGRDSLFKGYEGDIPPISRCEYETYGRMYFSDYHNNYVSVVGIILAEKYRDKWEELVDSVLKEEHGISLDKVLQLGGGCNTYFYRYIGFTEAAKSLHVFYEENDRYENWKKSLCYDYSKPNRDGYNSNTQTEVKFPEFCTDKFLEELYNSGKRSTVLASEIKSLQSKITEMINILSYFGWKDCSIKNVVEKMKTVKSGYEMEDLVHNLQNKKVYEYSNEIMDSVGIPSKPKHSKYTRRPNQRLPNQRQSNLTPLAYASGSGTPQESGQPVRQHYGRSSEQSGGRHYGRSRHRREHQSRPENSTLQNPTYSGYPTQSYYNCCGFPVFIPGEMLVPMCSNQTYLDQHAAYLGQPYSQIQRSSFQ